MSLNKKNIKLKIVKLDEEIKYLEKKIIEITWQRAKYVQFYEKINEHKGFQFDKMKFLRFLILIFIIANVNAEYFVENAFPNINFIDPVGIYNANDGTSRIWY